MTARYFRYAPLLVVALAGCLTLSAADEKRRAFGPEWKKIDPKSDLGKFGCEYERPVTVAVRHTYGNVAGFEVPLECGDVVGAHEIDADAGSAVRVRARDGQTYGEFEVSKGPKGKAESFTVTVGPNRYFDLDADGQFDAMYDNRSQFARKPMILFDGRFVPVEDQKSLFRAARGETIQVWGVGRTEQYEFAKGRWSRVK
jgi:hypothetical protein